MAIEWVIEKHDGRQGQRSLKNERRYIRNFQVKTTSNQDDSLVVLGSTALPAIGQAYITPNASDLGALVKNRTATQSADDPLIWLVVCEYDNAVTDPEIPENPLLRPATWRFGFAKLTRPIQKDFSDQPKPIVNSSGQPFDPAIEIDQSTPTINLSVARPVFSYVYAMSLVDRVNDDAWAGFNAGTLKMGGIDITSQFDPVYGTYWAINYTIECKWDGWNPLKVLDSGYYEKEEVYQPGGAPALVQLKLIRDNLGQPLNAPALLDGAGKKLGADAEPVYLEFKAYRETSFALIGIL